MTGPFTANTVLASNDGVGDQVVTVNQANGKLTAFVQHLNTTKGLVYLTPNGTQTQLPLNGATPTRISAVKTAAITPKASSGSSNTALIVALIAAVLVLLGGGGLVARRRMAT